MTDHSNFWKIIDDDKVFYESGRLTPFKLTTFPDSPCLYMKSMPARPGVLFACDRCERRFPCMKAAGTTLETIREARRAWGCQEIEAVDWKEERRLKFAAQEAKKSGPKADTEKNEAVRRLYGEGKSPADIAKIYGVTPEAVRSRLKRNGVVLRKQGGRARREQQEAQ